MTNRGFLFIQIFLLSAGLCIFFGRNIKPLSKIDKYSTSNKPIPNGYLLAGGPDRPYLKDLIS